MYVFFKDDDDEEDGEAYDLSKMSRENGEEETDEPVKVHEIKFDEFGIMEDGLDDSTHQKLNPTEGMYSKSFYFFNLFLIF